MKQLTKMQDRTNIFGILIYKSYLLHQQLENYNFWQGYGKRRNHVLLVEL